MSCSISAGIQQTNNDLFAFDTSNLSRFAGLEVSGFLGYTILRQLATRIDYRDGLIKFDYDPKHGNREFALSPSRPDMSARFRLQ